MDYIQDVLTRFDKDIVQHRMHVKHNDGLYRHIVCCRDESSNMHFELSTVPGYLFYSGDMGSFVFCREPDMFDFFKKGFVSDRIDFQYYHSKLEAVDKNGGSMEDSPSYFKAAGLEIVNGLSDDAADLKARARQTLEEALAVWGLDGANAAYRRLVDEPLCDGLDSDPEVFNEMPTPRVFSFRFVWACFAIRWAIRGFYDFEAQQNLVAPAVKPYF